MALGALLEEGRLRRGLVQLPASAPGDPCQGDVTTSWLPGSAELDGHTWSHSGCVGSSAIGEHELKLSLRTEIPNQPSNERH